MLLGCPLGGRGELLLGKAHWESVPESISSLLETLKRDRECLQEADANLLFAC